jgi:tetratricopeptide (TPR) repeat protein
LGTVAVVLAFFVTARELRQASTRVAQLTADGEQLAQRNSDLKWEAESLSVETRGLREALTAARAAITAYHAGDFAGAVALYDKVIRNDSTNAYLLNLRAYSLFRAGRYDEALRSQQLSLRADSSYAWGYFDLARFQCALGQWTEAKTTIERLLRIAPSMRATMDGDGEFRRVCRRVYP